MRRAVVIASFLLILAYVHVVTLDKSATERKKLPRGEGSAFVLPSSLVKITALEFDGLVSDILFLDAIVFYGGTHERTERPRVKEWEWQWLEKTISSSTDLDPYFLDPYLLGNAIFTWEAGMIRETNELLKKGSRSRTWDWKLPFFTGFNYFYFLQENASASENLMEAARRKNDDPFLVRLASKLAFKERRTEVSIQFLEEMVSRTGDELVRDQFSRRIKALKNILFLEQAVEAYRKRFRRRPASIDSLIDKGIISQVPTDPYGGSYFLSEKGEVRSTMEGLLLPTIRKPTKE